PAKLTSSPWGTLRVVRGVRVDVRRFRKTPPFPWKLYERPARPATRRTRTSKVAAPFWQPAESNESRRILTPGRKAEPVTSEIQLDATAESVFGDLQALFSPHGSVAAVSLNNAEIVAEFRPGATKDTDLSGVPKASL